MFIFFVSAVFLSAAHIIFICYKIVFMWWFPHVHMHNRSVISLWLILSYLTEGANGDGMAVVTSLRSFDREQQKEYLIPIVIKDSGNPAMSGTSTLTVVIGDVNDNKMQPGTKDIFVYNYMVSCLSLSYLF